MTWSVQPKCRPSGCPAGVKIKHHGLSLPGTLQNLRLGHSYLRILLKSRLEDSCSIATRKLGSDKLLAGAMWFLPESPRWLVVDGQLDAALGVIHRIYTKNKLPLGEPRGSWPVHVCSLECSTALLRLPKHGPAAHLSAQCAAVFLRAAAWKRV